ncbi:MAG TPA: acylphosphatase [Steroidobacteraceae bacterium]
MDQVVRRFLIFGKVQGVYFRHSTRLEARRLNIRGIARNLPDGSVEVVAQGDAAAVDGLRAWLQHGPAEARVDEVRETALDDVQQIPKGFEVI